jgi:hypothetical protein
VQSVKSELVDEENQLKNPYEGYVNVENVQKQNVFKKDVKKATKVAKGWIKLQQKKLFKKENVEQLKEEVAEELKQGEID